MGKPEELFFDGRKMSLTKEIIEGFFLVYVMLFCKARIIRFHYAITMHTEKISLYLCQLH